MKYQYALHTNYGDGLFVVDILQQEGKSVNVIVRDKDFQFIYDGFKGIDKSKTLPDWISKISKETTVIFDSVGHGELGDELRRRGFNVIGGQKFGDKLELDREFGMQFMADHGVLIPETFVFSDLKDGIKFAKENKGRWVFKPYGKKQGLSADTYVSNEEEDLIDFISKFKIQAGQKYILQKFIEGKEISTELFFSKGLPMGSPSHTVETKKFLSGDLGCNTGCMSTVEGLGSMNSLIVQEGIAKCFPGLLKEQFTGNLDLNTIVSKKDGKIYGLEFTPRFGFSSYEAQCVMLGEPQNIFLSRMARGTLEETKYKPGYGLSLRVSIPPYPLEANDENMKHTLPLLRETANEKIGYNEKAPVKYFWQDVYEKDDMVWTAGNDGIVVEIACHGITIEEAETKIFKAAKEMIIGDIQYRGDAFERAKEYFKDPEIIKYIGENNE